MTEEKRQGFTQIDNDILEVVARCKFNGSQFRILTVIWRYTFGFQRVDHEFSVGYLQKATKLSDRAIKKELTYLIENKVLKVTQHETRTTPRKLLFNINYASWLVDGVEDVVNNDSPHTTLGSEQLFTSVGNNSSPQVVNNDSPQVGNNSSPKKETILNKSIKENINKQSDSEYTDDFIKFWEIYPRSIKKKEAFKTFQQVIKKGVQAQDIIQAASHYSIYCEQMKTEERYIMHPKTFLNDGRYEDYLERVNINGTNKRTGQFDFLNNDDGHWRGDEDGESIPIDLEGLL